MATRAPRLRRTDCSTPGLTRRRRGRGFEYLDLCGDRVDDVETLERIRALAIPPAWADVWISPFPNGHLQAVGTDAAGRRQYLYHEHWRVRRDQEKFDRMLLFAHALPRVRRAVAADLRRDDLSRDRVLAGAIRLLDIGLFRVGNEAYAEQNGSYGLTTLERRHAAVNGKSVLFDYTAKSGIRRRQAIADPAVRDLVATLKKRRGDAHLFAFQAGRGARWSPLRSDEINVRLKELTGIEEASAKDFRTWHGTVLAATELAGAEARTKSGREREVRRAVAEVAELLGNTPAVARSSYVDPRVLDRYRAGATIEIGGRRTRSRIERAVLDLLTD